MKILATGLDGLVGSRFVELFPNYEITNLSLKTGVDITDLDQIKPHIKDQKILIHFAAFTDVGKAYEERGDKQGLCYRVNVLGTKNVTQVCAKNKIHLIHISTDYVFDGQTNKPLTEKDQPNPIEWYGQTKFEAEQIVQSQLEKYTIARISFPYRAQYREKQDIVAKTVQAISDGSIYPQFTDTLITPTFIDDIAQALHKIIRQRARGLFHVTGSGAVSNYEFATSVAHIYNLDKSIIKEGSFAEFSKNNKGRPYHQYLYLDNSKIQKQLSVKMSSLKKGLQAIKKQQ